ncbi:protein DMR6-LIKE OXYGENASE 1 [Sesamum indicum]|uniref:Protein DMR6-LIKE OXYGENASE 1 n=1 Tax=Sesamum indicum TaxID=4182 RepID=A0A6I9TH21_SESIN|nr:protein DMR6-LIKE OXYGENASE 1 [Sesamum indicum]
MEKLISSKHNIQHVPESYILPPEIRPGRAAIPSCKSIPVIDLHGNIDSNRQDLVQRIMEAGQEFGFFQLTNHGVPEELMKETVKVAEEFFQLPVEDKASFYSEDPRRGCRLSTSIDYDHEKVHFWRDNLRHHCRPLEDHVGEWPTNPTRYREVIGNYAVRVRELSLVLLDLICEGLGIESGYFEGGLSRLQMMSLNYYPPCPDPALTLGLPKHADPNLITVLNQGAVPGLQVLKDEKWLALEPVPNAFVVNIGHALQVISNGMLRSAEHRVVTNAFVARATVTSFIQPSNDSLIGPATLLVDRCSLPLYRPFRYDEFLRTYIKDAQDGKPPLKQYEISQT